MIGRNLDIWGKLSVRLESEKVPRGILDVIFVSN